MSTPEEAKEPANDGIGLAMTVTVLLLAGGMAVPLVAVVPHRSAGARRSVQLEFQARDAQIAKAVQEQQGTK